MKKGILIGTAMLTFALLASMLALNTTNAEEPSLTVMYANDWDSGNVADVIFDPYSSTVTNNHNDRLDPGNVLGEFDAVQTASNGNQYFYGLAAREWTKYTFEADFLNVDGVPDIEFAEVTWGSWHVEAALVYLTDAYVDSGGSIVSYGATDDGIGYYAGVVWNKEGNDDLTASERLTITESYFTGTRTFTGNTFTTDGNFEVSQFYLPSEVEYAKGIYLVDITDEIYDDGGQTTTYTGNADGSGTKVTVTGIDPVTVTTASGYDGNTDGYDLDAIRVYKKDEKPPGGDDTATGYGTPILEKGTWFMYNYYDGGDNTGPYDIQAGNPKGGLNFIGEITVTDEGDGYYTVEYDMDDTITIDDWEYDIVVEDEHLGIDVDTSSMDFKAVPGQDDNADFGTSFYDSNGEFYFFAHFAVVYE